MQDNKTLIPIERKMGVTIYGRVIGKGGKLGQFEVISDYFPDLEIVYSTYAEAEKRFAALVGASPLNNQN